MPSVLSFGGFWAWDPVENASLVPWMTMVGAGHVMLVYKHRNHSLLSAYLLCIATFILILYSTFLTRAFDQVNLDVGLHEQTVVFCLDRAGITGAAASPMDLVIASLGNFRQALDAVLNGKLSSADFASARAAAMIRAGDVVAPHGLGQRQVGLGVGAHPFRRELERPHLGRAEVLDDLRAGVGRQAAVEDAGGGLRVALPYVALTDRIVTFYNRVAEEVQHLLKIVAIKALCRQANVEKIEAGPKGAVITFRDNSFANPDALVAFIRKQGASARVRPDMKVVFFDEWERPEERLKGATAILRSLADLAQPAKAA